MPTNKGKPKLFCQLWQVSTDLPFDTAGICDNAMGGNLCAMCLYKINIRLGIQTEIEDVRLAQLLFSGNAVNCAAF